MRTWLSVAVIFVVAGGLIVGCGGSDAATNLSSEGNSASQATNSATPADPAAQVAFEFLDAVRSGDIETASSKLSPLALQRTSELDMSFSPPGSPTASFQIGAVDQIEADKAIVESIWTDVDPDGLPQEEQIVWALRLVDGGWRISGMAAQVDSEQPAVIIDFENPGALFQQQAPADTATSSPPAVQTATDPFQQATAR